MLGTNKTRKIYSIAIFLYTLLNMISSISSLLSEETISNILKIAVDQDGKIITERKTKQTSTFTFSLSRMRELDTQNNQIRAISQIKFSNPKKEDTFFRMENYTKLNFIYNFTTGNNINFTNQNATLELNLYYIKELTPNQKLRGISQNSFYVAYNLTNYEFCDQNSTFNECIETPSVNGSLPIFKNGKSLEFELNFANNNGEQYKIFFNAQIGKIVSGDFIYTIFSNFYEDQNIKKIDSKDVDTTNNKTTVKFSRFKKELSFVIFVNSMVEAIQQDDDDIPSKVINLNTSKGIQISMNPVGGKLSFTKFDENLNYTKYLDLSLISLQEGDQKGKNLILYNNVYHNISELNKAVFKTEDFKKDKYENISISKSRFYLKNQPDKDTIIYSDIIIFEENGNFTFDGDRYVKVKSGDIKIHFGVINWPFCKYNSFASQQNCQIVEDGKEIVKEGSYLDLRISIKGKKAPSLMPYTEDKYSMDDISYIYTGVVQIDNKIEKATSKLENKDNNFFITVRFPAFSKTAAAQILINLDTPSGPYNSLIYLIGGLALFAGGLIIFMCISKRIKQHDQTSDKALLPK